MARLREHARPPEWALTQAAQELDVGDDADDEALDEDDLEAEDEADEQLSDEAAIDADDDGAEVVEEIACIPLNGQLAPPSAVWEAAKAQLRFQMVRGAYDNWVADTRCVGVGDGPDEAGASQILVVQAADCYAVEWLELRLKRLIQRTLQGLVGSPLDVRFQADGQTPAP